MFNSILISPHEGCQYPYLPLSLQPRQNQMFPEQQTSRLTTTGLNKRQRSSHWVWWSFLIFPTDFKNWGRATISHGPIWKFSLVTEDCGHRETPWSEPEQRPQTFKAAWSPRGPRKKQKKPVWRLSFVITTWVDLLVCFSTMSWKMSLTQCTF